MTLVHFLRGFDSGVKPWVLPDIRNRIEAGEIVVRRDFGPGDRLFQRRLRGAQFRQPGGDLVFGQRQRVTNIHDAGLFPVRLDDADLRCGYVPVAPRLFR